MKNGELFLLNGHIVRLIEKKKSSPGKHGSAKYHVFVADVFTGKRTEELYTGKALVGVPAVEREDLMVISYDDEMYVTVLHNGQSRPDVPLEATSDLGIRVRRFLQDGKSVYLNCLTFGQGIPIPQSAKAE